MDFFEVFNGIIDFGEVGVGIAQIITALNPASWWASGILGLVGLLLSVLGGTTAE